MRVLVSPSLIMQDLRCFVALFSPIGGSRGIPLYACGGAAIPLIQVLTEMGMTPGAALAFFSPDRRPTSPRFWFLGALFQINFLTLYYAVTLGGAVIVEIYLSMVGGDHIAVRATQFWRGPIMRELSTYERMKRMYDHQEADRVPITDTPWESTVERWRREGMET